MARDEQRREGGIAQQRVEPWKGEPASVDAPGRRPASVEDGGAALADDDVDDGRLESQLGVVRREA
jgi:hypothetical protein